MKIDSSFSFGDQLDDIDDIKRRYIEFENQGFDGVVTAEIQNDPFLVVGEPLQVAEQIKSRYGKLVDRITLENNLPTDLLQQQMAIIRGQG